MIKTPNYLYLLFGFILISSFIPLGLTPLFDLDEGAFSEATREMLIGKDYITTYLNGELRFDKPILIYWLQLLSVKIFGINEFAFRLPSAIAASLWAIVVYLFTSKFLDKKKGFFAALFLITSLQTTIIAKAAIADALLNLFIALSLFLIYNFFITRKKSTLYLAFVFIALGTLAKGPVAIFIPFSVSFIFFALKREFLLWLKSIFNPIGLLIFALIALPWYIAEYIDQGQLFIDGFFFKHNIGRFSGAMEKHGGGVYYYIIVILIGLLPFTALFLKSLSKIKSLVKDDLTLFLLIWFGFVFIFFSFSGTKLPHYIIYGYTPIFILSALSVGDFFSKLWILLPMLFLSVILLFFPEIVVFLKDQIRDSFVVVLIDHVYENFDFTYRILMTAIVLILVFLTFYKITFEKVVIVSALLMVILINYTVLPTYGKLMQSPVKEAALIAKQKGYLVHMYNNQMPSFNVYYEGIVSKEKPKSGDIVFCKVTSSKDFASYKTLYKKNGFNLIRIEK